MLSDFKLFNNIQDIGNDVNKQLTYKVIDINESVKLQWKLVLA